MSTEFRMESFLRLSSISIAAYDYLITLPAEMRMYRSTERSKFGWSFSIVLFILIRYTSIILLAISNIGWLYHGFSEDACLVYYFVAPVFKVVQIIISQVIIGYLTWNVSQRSKETGIFLLVFGSGVVVLQSYANLNSRIPVQDDGNCSPGNSESDVPQWMFYLLCTCFDFTVIITSSFFLIKSSRGINRMSSFLKMLLYDGIGYVIFLTVVNFMNMVLYRNSIGEETQSSGASFGYMAVWIMSQKFLINVYEAAEVRALNGTPPHPASCTFASDARAKRIRDNNKGAGLGIQVQVERAVMIDYNPKTHQQGAFLDGKQGNTVGENASFIEQG